MQRLIHGTIITPLNRIYHQKGDILHGIKKTEECFKGFGEAYFSIINPLHVKAWKIHYEMTLNLIVPVGQVKVVVYDDRKDSPTYQLLNEFFLSSSNYNRLTIPPRLWVGFKGIDTNPSFILNIANIVHDPKEQLNVSIEDSEINYNWNL